MSKKLDGDTIIITASVWIIAVFAIAGALAFIAPPCAGSTPLISILERHHD